MIAGSHYRNACPQKIDGDFSGDPPSASRVFSIYDREIDAMLRFQFRKAGKNCRATGFAYHVTEKKDPEHFAIFVLKAAKSNHRCFIAVVKQIQAIALSLLILPATAPADNL